MGFSLKQLGNCFNDKPFYRPNSVDKTVHVLQIYDPLDRCLVPLDIFFQISTGTNNLNKGSVSVLC